jgi:hypothetical protein
MMLPIIRQKPYTVREFNRLTVPSRADDIDNQKLTKLNGIHSLYILYTYIPGKPDKQKKIVNNIKL